MPSWISSPPASQVEPWIERRAGLDHPVADPDELVHRSHHNQLATLPPGLEPGDQVRDDVDGRRVLEIPGPVVPLGLPDLFLAVSVHLQVVPARAQGADRERVGVARHEGTLPDRGCDLEGRQVPGSLIQATALVMN